MSRMGRYALDLSDTEEGESHDDQSSISRPPVQGQLKNPQNQQSMFPPLPRQVLLSEDEESDRYQPIVEIPSIKHLNLADQGVQDEIDETSVEEMPRPEVNLTRGFKIHFSSSGDFYLPTSSPDLMQFKLKCELQSYKDAVSIMNEAENNNLEIGMLMKLLTKHFDGRNSDMCMVWSLMSILFGDGDLDCCKVLGKKTELESWVNQFKMYGTDDMESVRRKSLYKWLRYWINTNEPFPKYQDQLDYIIEHLSRLNPEKAMVAAEEADYSYLAGIIAASNSSRELLQSELQRCENSGLVDCFPPNITQVYEILRGNPEILKRMPWKRALGMIIQHFEDQSIHSIFKFYRNIVPETELNSKHKLDVCFVLISLYGESAETIPQLGKLLHPYSIGDAHSVGFSWIMYYILKQIFDKHDVFSHIFENMQSRVECEGALNSLSNSGLLFSQELEISGYWEWAVYVLQSLKDSEQLIKDVLARHVTYQTEVQNNMLVNRLKVPKAWVYDAISISCEYYLMHKEALQYSMEVSNILRVHNILIKEIAPLYIIKYPGTDVYEELYEQFILPLEKFKTEITSWNQAEEVYIKYLDIKKMTEEGSLNVNSLIKELMPLLDELPFYSDTQQAAVQFMKYNLVKWNCDALEMKVKMGSYLNLRQEIIFCAGLSSTNKIRIAERIGDLYLQTRN